MLVPTASPMEYSPMTTTQTRPAVSQELGVKPGAGAVGDASTHAASQRKVTMSANVGVRMFRSKKDSFGSAESTSAAAAPTNKAAAASHDDAVDRDSSRQADRTNQQKPGARAPLSVGRRKMLNTEHSAHSLTSSPAPAGGSSALHEGDDSSSDSDSDSEETYDFDKRRKFENSWMGRAFAAVGHCTRSLVDGEGRSDTEHVHDAEWMQSHLGDLFVAAGETTSAHTGPALSTVSQLYLHCARVASVAASHCTLTVLSLWRVHRVCLWPRRDARGASGRGGAASARAHTMPALASPPPHPRRALSPHPCGEPLANALLLVPATQVLRQGELSDRVYLILEGTAIMRKQQADGSVKDIEGHRVPGNTLGELSFLLGTPCSVLSARRAPTQCPTHGIALAAHARSLSPTAPLGSLPAALWRYAVCAL